MAMETGNSGHLIRSEVWSSQLKEVLEDELQATTYVNWMNDFPDGDTFTIPSIGQAVTDDYSENSAVQYRALDTGESSSRLISTNLRVTTLRTKQNRMVFT